MALNPQVVHFAVDMIFDDDTDEETDPTEKIWDFFERTVPNFNNRQFQHHFRMNSTTFENIVIKLHSIVQVKLNGNIETSVEKQLLIAIWYLANIEAFR